MKMKRWVSKHNRLIGLVGALIVLTTFIVKDALHEHLKEIVDEEHAKRNLISIRQDNNAFSRQLDLLQIIISNTSAPPNGTEAQVRCDLAYFEMLNGIPRRYGNQIDAVAELEYALLIPPYHTKEEEVNIEATMGHVIDTVIPEQKKLGQAYAESLYDEIKAIQRDDHGLAVALAITGKSQLKDFAQIMREMNRTFTETAQDELKRSDAIITRDDYVYRQCTYLSYVLYTLGWGLALVSRFYGVDGSSM